MAYDQLDMDLEFLDHIEDDDQAMQKYEEFLKRK